MSRNVLADDLLLIRKYIVFLMLPHFVRNVRSYYKLLCKRASARVISFSTKSKHPHLLRRKLRLANEGDDLNYSPIKPMWHARNNGATNDYAGKE
jgi:hypothetical protein